MSKTSKRLLVFLPLAVIIVAFGVLRFINGKFEAEAERKYGRAKELWMSRGYDIERGIWRKADGREVDLQSEI